MMAQAQAGERLADLIADPQPPEPVQQGDRLLDHPAVHARVRSVLRASPATVAARHPRPDPSCCGRNSHGIPVYSTNKIPGQHLAVIRPLAVRVTSLPRDRGQQRLDTLPSPVRHHPRWLLVPPRRRSTTT